MTQAFNLGLLANKVNSSGQLDGPTGITGAVPTATNVAGSGITGSQSIPKSTLPTGSVLQVVTSILGSQTAVTSQTYVNIFSAAITPTSASSKILVLTSVPVYLNSGGNGAYTVFRGSTDLVNSNYNPSRGFMQSSNGGNWNFQFALSYLDSPATTSSTTYYFSARVQGASQTTQVGQDGTGNIGMITLMEIAA